MRRHPYQSGVDEDDDVLSQDHRSETTPITLETALAAAPPPRVSPIGNAYATPLRAGLHLRPALLPQIRDRP